MPTIITPPANQTIGSGKETTPTVVANSPQPLTFQWRLNGQNTYGTTVSKVAELTYFALSMHADLTIAGTAGTHYRIESVPALAGSTNWTTLINIVSQTSSYLFIDDQSPGQAQRFSGVVPRLLQRPSPVRRQHHGS